MGSVLGWEPKSIPVCWSVQCMKGMPQIFPALLVVIAWGKIIALFHLTSDGHLTFQIACLSVLSQYPIGLFYIYSKFVPYLLQKLKNSVFKQMSCVIKERQYVTICLDEVYKVQGKVALS